MQKCITAKEVADCSDDFVSNSYMFVINIRGTATYWKNELSNLVAKMNTLGAPTFFMTLTANDRNWYKFYQCILPRMSIEDIKALSSSQKQYLLKTHPVQAVMFFERRLDIFWRK